MTLGRGSLEASSLSAALLSGPPLVIDGGLATELEARGAKLDDALWSARLLLDDPHAVRSVHAAYVEAGADILISGSYQASTEAFVAVGETAANARTLASRAIEASVHLAREAARGAGRRVFVVGSLGTIGASLSGGAEYRGRFALPRSRYVDHHAPRIEALLQAAPDAIACETLPDLDEAEALVDLLASFDAQGWLSFTCADELELRGGAPVERAFELCADADAVIAAGVNCTAPQHVAALLGRAHGHCPKPLLAYPNSGEDWDASARSWTGKAQHEAQHTDFAQLAGSWLANGARAIGGCCRTAPSDIAALRELVHRGSITTG